MATRPFPLAPATDAEVTAALVPFIARYVWSAKRARVTALCVPWRKRAGARDLVDALDPAHVIELVGAPAPSREARALARVRRATPGVFIDEGGGHYRAQLDAALDELDGDPALFIAADGSCGVALFEIGASWLIVESR
ncbi:MAG: hypothetical protein K8W52_01035 [Deltaproteobacteria bacterium]|nr:hypothetical protein [Deltaproteobacteria bacterium]